MSAKHILYNKKIIQQKYKIICSAHGPIYNCIFPWKITISNTQETDCHSAYLHPSPALIKRHNNHKPTGFFMPDSKIPCTQLHRVVLSAKHVLCNKIITQSEDKHVAVVYTCRILQRKFNVSIPTLNWLPNWACIARLNWIHASVTDSNQMA